MLFYGYYFVNSLLMAQKAQPIAPSPKSRPNGRLFGIRQLIAFI